MNYKRIAAFGMLNLALVLCGCQTKASADNEATQQKTEISYEDNDYYTEYENAAFTEIDLDKGKRVFYYKEGSHECHKRNVDGKIEAGKHQCRKRPCDSLQRWQKADSFIV